jgi:hypothetical protein
MGLPAGRRNDAPAPSLDDRSGDAFRRKAVRSGARLIRLERGAQPQGASRHAPELVRGYSLARCAKARPAFEQL